MKRIVTSFLLILFALVTCHQIASAQTESKIYFEQTELTYELGSTEPFVAPKLINPDNDQVWFQSSNSNIVSVGYYDGAVTIIKEGVVTITASSYYSGMASYTLTVTDNRQASGITYDVKEVTYDITSDKPFEAPVLNNPNGVEVTYTSSNYKVATIDYYTGVITINGVGETIIGASSEAVDGYKPTTAQYKLTVIDPEILYNAQFVNGNDGWTEEGTTNVWQWNYYGNMYCDGSYKVNTLCDSYLVSPEIDFDAAGNLITFEHMASGFNNWESQARLVVREVGGEWVDCGNIAAPDEWQFSYSGKIKFPEQFNGKKVQIAFKYTTDGYQMIGQWYVKNITVKKYVKKADPQISFDVTEFTHDIGKAFTAPVLNNPNNVEIEYSTSDFAVAGVDAKTGEVKLYNSGVVTITATSKEDKTFDSATASYTITVTDKGKILEASFLTDLCGFTEEGTLKGIWKYSYNYANASGGSVATEPTECLLVSPEITLKSSNTFEFEHMPQQYSGQDISKIAKFAIRESNGDVKGEWTYLAINYPPESAYMAEKTGKLQIPAEFDNKNVQVAFVYVANGTYWQWWVRNLTIRGVEQAEKADPEISFEETSVEYFLDSEKLFIAPVLNNPNNVDVKYSSSNTEVAKVDEITGKVEFIAEGEVVITATSVETDIYKSATASYTIVVKITPTGIEAVLQGMDMKNAKIYDLQGRKVNKLGKGIFIINGKKVVIK